MMPCEEARKCHDGATRTLLLLILGLAASPAVAKTFTWAFNGDALTVDPHASNNTFTNAFVNNVYEGLVRQTIRSRSSPRWPLVEAAEPTVWRFTLRKGVKFHSGADFDADDVVATWQRMNTPGALVMTVVNPIKDVRKVDSHTWTSRPSSRFHPAVDPHALFRDGQRLAREERRQGLHGPAAEKGDFANRNANGTGPSS